MIRARENVPPYGQRQDRSCAMVPSTARGSSSSRADDARPSTHSLPRRHGHARRLPSPAWNLPLYPQGGDTMPTTRILRAFASILFAALCLASTAEARDRDRDWGYGRHHGGSSFRVGGVDLHVVVSGRTRGGHGYFIEASNLPRYRGYQCNDRCYVARGTMYHHPTCPWLRHHLSRYDFDPGYLVPRYPPAHHGIPPGHLPPPGMCRVWFDDRPPGHQPPPVSCAEAAYYAPPGARILYGGPGR